MICEKCGTQMDDNATICPGCGTKCGSSPNSGADNKVQGLGNLPPITIDPSKKFVYIEMAVLFIGLIFTNFASFKLTESGYEYMKFSVFEVSGFIQFLFDLFYLVSIGVILLYHVIKNESKTWIYIPAKVTAVLTVVWLFYARKAAIGGDADYYYAIGANVGLSFSGIVYIVAAIAALILAFKITRSIKKAALPPKPENTKPTDNSGSKS